MRWLGLMAGIALATALSFTADGATVTLDGGRQLKGRVIVRGDVMTVLAQDQGGQRLYQFPMSDVVKITAEDPESPNIVSRQTALRASDSRRSEPLFELERGMEVKRLAVRGGWVQVEAWSAEAQGFILESELAAEVDLSPEERASVRARLGVIDPLPPPHSTAPPRRKEPPPSKNEPEAAESIIEEVSQAGRQSDASVTE